MAKQTPRADIKDFRDVLMELMAPALSAISDGMIAQAMTAWRAKKRKLGDVNWPGEMEYRTMIRDSMTIAASDAIIKARKEVPAASDVKLVEESESLLFSSSPTVLLSKLPKVQRDFIAAQTDLLVDTQLKDLEKNLKYQYMDSYDTSGDEAVIEDDLRKVCVDFIDGNSVRAGAELLASKTINEARSAFFFDSDTLEHIEAFEFVNGDPVTPICQDLAGTIFAKDDPNMFRYTPPLHWNCKSYIVPILNGNVDSALKKAGQSSIEPLKPSTKKLEDSIQFSEAGCNCAGCT